MNYQIKYEWTGEARRISSSVQWLRYIGFALLGVALCGAAIWSMGADWAVTVGALEGMAEDLGQGNDLKAAFSAFCLEVLQGAEGG